MVHGVYYLDILSTIAYAIVSDVIKLSNMSKEPHSI